MHTPKRAKTSKNPSSSSLNPPSTSFTPSTYITANLLPSSLPPRPSVSPDPIVQPFLPLTSSANEDGRNRAHPNVEPSVIPSALSQQHLQYGPSRFSADENSFNNPQSSLFPAQPSPPYQSTVAGRKDAIDPADRMTPPAIAIPQTVVPDSDPLTTTQPLDFTEADDTQYITDPGHPTSPPHRDAGSGGKRYPYTNARGDTVYFKSSFVDPDPWALLKKKKELEKMMLDDRDAVEVE